MVLTNLDDYNKIRRDVIEIDDFGVKSYADFDCRG